MLTSGSFTSDSEKPVTVMIVEGVMEFAIDAGEEAEIPLIYFETFSPCGLWACFCVPRLIDAGEIPFDGLWFILKDEVVFSCFFAIVIRKFHVDIYIMFDN